MARGDFDPRLLALLSEPARSVFGQSLEAYLKTDQLQDYRPYLKQAQFHIAGAKYRNRLLKAGNQLGKTYSCGAEVAMHLTGEYPEWWEGKRFHRPITCWAASENGEATRDNTQRMLLGKVKEVGTGMIPKRCITDIYGMSKMVTGLFDYVYIKHISGGVSLLRFRYYTQQRSAWQGPPVDLLWTDEEPPEDINAEGQARTIAVQGIQMMSFTPLLGHTPVVNSYLQDNDPDETGRWHITMTIYDAGHLTDAERDAEIKRWPKHQQKARIYGEPAMGVGQIYPYDTDEIQIEPFEIPDHWRILGAIDVSGSSAAAKAHPTAAVKLAYDPDNDVLYITNEYREKGRRPDEHFLRLKHWGRELRWAWPKDAAAEKGAGSQIILAYKEEGMNALPVHAQYPKRKREDKRGSSFQDSPQSIVSVERGIIDVGGRLEDGRLRVFKNCERWFSEMRQYHRDEDMKIVEIQDDLMDATRYGVMMLRFAQPKVTKTFRQRETVDWQVGF